MQKEIKKLSEIDLDSEQVPENFNTLVYNELLVLNTDITQVYYCAFMGALFSLCNLFILAW